MVWLLIVFTSLRVEQPLEPKIIAEYNSKKECIDNANNASKGTSSLGLMKTSHSKWDFICIQTKSNSTFVVPNF